MSHHIHPSASASVDAGDGTLKEEAKGDTESAATDLEHDESAADARVRIDSMLGAPPDLLTRQPENEKIPSRQVRVSESSIGASRTIVRVYPPVIESVTRLQSSKRRSRVVPQHHQIARQAKTQTSSRQKRQSVPLSAEPSVSHKRQSVPPNQESVSRKRQSLPLSPSFLDFVNDLNLARPISVHLNFPDANKNGEEKEKSGSKIKRALRKVAATLKRPFGRKTEDVQDQARLERLRAKNRLSEVALSGPRPR